MPLVMEEYYLPDRPARKTTYDLGTYRHVLSEPRYVALRLRHSRLYRVFKSYDAYIMEQGPKLERFDFHFRNLQLPSNCQCRISNPSRVTTPLREVRID